MLSETRVVLRCKVTWIPNKSKEVGGPSKFNWSATSARIREQVLPGSRSAWVLSWPHGPCRVTGTTWSKTLDLLHVACITWELATKGSGWLGCMGDSSGVGTLVELSSSMILWSNSLWSLVQPLTPHCLLNLHLFAQCLPKQRKQSPCSFTLANLSWTDNSLNLGQLCSLWFFPSPITRGGKINLPFWLKCGEPPEALPPIEGGVTALKTTVLPGCFPFDLWSCGTKGCLFVWAPKSSCTSACTSIHFSKSRRFACFSSLSLLYSFHLTQREWGSLSTTNVQVVCSL